MAHEAESQRNPAPSLSSLSLSLGRVLSPNSQSLPPSPADSGDSHRRPTTSMLESDRSTRSTCSISRSPPPVPGATNPWLGFWHGGGMAAGGAVPAPLGNPPRLLPHAPRTAPSPCRGLRAPRVPLRSVVDGDCPSDAAVAGCALFGSTGLTCVLLSPREEAAVGGYEHII